MSDMIDYYCEIVDHNFNSQYFDNSFRNDIHYLKEKLSKLFFQKNVLELAAGAGFWTDHLAKENTVLALDANFLDANLRMYNNEKVLVKQCDLLNREQFKNSINGNTFSGIFASAWISHIDKNYLVEYFESMHEDMGESLKPDSHIVLIDHLYKPEWQNQRPIYFPSNGYGNSFQKRTLKNGKEIEVIKNFYEINDWVAIIRNLPFLKIVEWIEYEYFYWINLLVRE